MSGKDFLGLNIQHLPYFRGLLRAVEARFYQDFELLSPVLDLGCGDGDFASLTFDRSLDVGIDPSGGPVKKATKTNAYRMVVRGSGDQLPFPSGYFASAISNSVLEHIPNLHPVLEEVGRVLKPGSLFLFCVPNHQFLSNLSVSNFFYRLGLKKLANLYRAFFNRVSRHQHCDSPEVWRSRLEKKGFHIEDCWHYFSPSALHTLEWGHYFGLPSWVVHGLTQRWILAPARWNLALTRSLVQRYYDENPRTDEGAYTFYVTRRL
jgi:SAM-dependent methyltransferase